MRPGWVPFQVDKITISEARKPRLLRLLIATPAVLRPRIVAINPEPRRSCSGVATDEQSIVENARETSNLVACEVFSWERALVVDSIPRTAKPWGCSWSDEQWVADWLQGVGSMVGVGLWRAVAKREMRVNWWSWRRVEAHPVRNSRLVHAPAEPSDITLVDQTLKIASLITAFRSRGHFVATLGN